MGKKRLLALALALAQLLSGCSAGVAEETAAGYAPPEEERLTIYTSHKEEVWWPIVKEFEERTGIWVDVVEGGTNELLERISRERDAPVADVMFGGGVESLTSYRSCFEPYTCAGAEQILDGYREAGDLWTPFSALPVVLIYNTKLVAPNEVTAWRDLFARDYRGQIAFANPAISGSSFTALVTLLYARGGETEQNFQAFAQQLGEQLSSSGSVLTAVAEGSALVGITLEETALKRVAAGDDIALVYPADGTSVVPDGSALVRGAPHRDNAQLFLDFTVSRDAQQMLVDQACRRSVRGDVELGETLIGLEEIPKVSYDVDWASANRELLLSAWERCLTEEGEP